MWSATRPTETGRYGWRPSPAEPGRPVDIVDAGVRGADPNVLFAIDATGHAVEGGEWWQGPTLYAWEQAVNAELLAAYRDLVNRIDSSRPCSIGAIGNAREAMFGTEEIYRWRELIERCEQQPADTRDATIARMRAALEACIAYMPCSEVHNWPPGFRLKDNAIKLARAALGEKS